MDFSHSSAAATAGLTSSALGFSERSLSSLSSDLTDNHHRSRMPSHHNMPPTSVGSMSPGLNPLKQCRSEMDLDGRGGDDRRGPLKLARTDSFSCRQSDLKMHMSSGSPGASLVRSNSVVSDGRLGCSPTNSCASDGALLGSDATVVSDSRQLMRSDSVVSAPAYSGAQQQQQAGRSSLSYHHQTYHYKPAGNSLNMSMQNIAGARAPFTSGQWAELEHQALIFKYMMAGVNVPPDLLNPIRKSVAAMNGLSAASHHATNMGWGTFHLGVASNADPEPGRCRRTDGKKWRCSRDVVPDQKYCERHMHRGRHRSRKPTDGQATSTSPAATASSAAANSSSVTTNRAVPGSAGSSLGHSNLSPTISASSPHGQQQHQSLGGMKSFGNSNNSGAGGGISIGTSGTSNSSGSQFQLPLQSASGASALGNKDYRYLNGMNKSDLGMGPEQLLFSETSGSARLGQDSPSMSNLSRLSSVNHSWQALSSKVPPAPQPKSGNNSNSSSNSLLHYTSPQMRSLLGGQDFGLMPESQVNNISSMQQQQQQQQQQHSFLSNGYGAVEAVSVVREPEGQPLRHFFDDWPRSRDPSALSWSDVEEERSNRSNASTTQLSISIPVTSSDFPSSNASPPRGKLSLSPLKLSMSRAGEEEQHIGSTTNTTTSNTTCTTSTTTSTDPTHMGLGVGMGLGMNIEDRHRQNTTWIPITWETPVGGPLAEVLQSSTPRGSAGCKSSGLNLLCDGWDSSPRDSPRMASPTGVLQKATFGSFSDSSSSGSSPRTIKSEPNGGVVTTCEQNTNLRSSSSVLVTGSSHLSS